MRPVILIPGIGGSIMVQKGSENRRLFHKSVPNNRWVNIYVATKHGLNKWKRDMNFNMVYDDAGKIDHIIPEVPLYAYDFGGSKGIKDIIPEFLLFPQQYQSIFEDLFHHRYFHHIIEFMYSLGYEDHVSLHGAPYDFRFILDPNVREFYFHQLRGLFEKSCARNGEKAIVITHSLGGIMFKWFISSEVDQEWVNKHIERWVCISAPFGGSYNALYAATSGDHYISSMRSTVQPELQRNMGIISCFPNDIAYDVNEPLAHITNGIITEPITIAKYDTFSENGLIPFKLWTDLYKTHLSTIKTQVRVPIHVVCGLKKNSTQSRAYLEAWDAVPYHFESCDGDGIVPLKSLLSVEKVIKRGSIIETMLPGVDHTTVLNDKNVMKIIQSYTLKSYKSI